MATRRQKKRETLIIFFEKAETIKRQLELEKRQKIVASTKRERRSLLSPVNSFIQTIFFTINSIAK